MVLFGYKGLYERERARADRLELELRQLNDLIRTQSMKDLADAHMAIRAATETIATLRRGLVGE